MSFQSIILGEPLDFDLKLMIFGIQLSILGGVILISTTPYYLPSVGATGFFLVVFGTILSLVGLLMRTGTKKP